MMWTLESTDSSIWTPQQPVLKSRQPAAKPEQIHRDLKPTNVLVTMADTVAFPTLLDFGIAKALGPSLTDNTLHTG